MDWTKQQELDREIVIFAHPSLEPFLKQIPIGCMVYPHDVADVGLWLRLHFQPNAIVLANVDTTQKLTTKQQIGLANQLALEALALLEEQITEIRIQIKGEVNND